MSDETNLDPEVSESASVPEAVEEAAPAEVAPEAEGGEEEAEKKVA